MLERDSVHKGDEQGNTGGPETGDGTSTSGQSGSVGDPSNDTGDVNRGDAGDSTSGNADGEEGGGPGSR